MNALIELTSHKGHVEPVLILRREEGLPPQPVVQRHVRVRTPDILCVQTNVVFFLRHDLAATLAEDSRQSQQEVGHWQLRLSIRAASNQTAERHQAVRLKWTVAVKERASPHAAERQRVRALGPVDVLRDRRGRRVERPRKCVAAPPSGGAVEEILAVASCVLVRVHAEHRERRQAIALHAQCGGFRKRYARGTEQLG